MSMVRCDKGHFYDSEKHSSCPHCGVNIDLDVVTRPGPQSINPTRALGSEDNGQKTVAKAKPVAENKTVGFFAKKQGIDPIVGWLVCVEGPDRGRDYRLRSGRNYIGRSESMDVCITGDKGISREKHAIVVYDPKKNHFIVQPGESREIFYLNDEGVYNVMPLNAFDVLELSDTKLQFVPFCGEGRTW